VVGAAPVLRLGLARALALAGLLAALVAYGASAESLPELRSRASLAVVALLVVPAFTATIWLALPLARVRPTYFVLIGGALAGIAWVALAFAGVGSVANVSKFSCFALIGLWFISLFEELWWVALVAVLVPWLDVWSVAVGPTRYVVEEQPGIFDQLSVAFAVPGDAGTVNLGPPDVIFFSLFLAAASRFALRAAWTWVAMTGFLALTLVLVWEWNVLGLPALPAICAGFIAPNVDLLWHHVRDEWRARQAGSEAG
jgi:hypothetical protein